MPENPIYDTPPRINYLINKIPDNLEYFEEPKGQNIQSGLLMNKRHLMLLVQSVNSQHAINLGSNEHLFHHSSPDSLIEY